jgi:hypothetical protein
MRNPGVGRASGGGGVCGYRGNHDDEPARRREGLVQRDAAVESSRKIDPDDALPYLGRELLFAGSGADTDGRGMDQKIDRRHRSPATAQLSGMLKSTVCQVARGSSRVRRSQPWTCRPSRCRTPTNACPRHPAPPVTTARRCSRSCRIIELLHIWSTRVFWRRRHSRPAGRL